MAIYHDEKKVFNRYHGRQQLLKKYHDSKLVWQFNEICRLPKEYQEVEYLENNSNAYIDLGVKGKYSYTTDIDFQITNTKKNGFLFGTRGTNTNPNKQTYETSISYSIGMWIVKDKVTNFDVWKTWTKEEGVARRYTIDNTTDRIRASLGDWGVMINGEIVKTNTPYDTNEETATNLFLFYNPYNAMGTTTPGSPLPAKVYSLTIYDKNGNVLRNYIPCYRKADNLGGMYETVEGKFYTSVNGSKFIYGADVKCEKLEYILASGNQYINLHLIPNSQHSFSARFEITNKSVNNNMIIGSRTDGTFQTSNAQIYMNWQKVDKNVVLRNRYNSNDVQFTENVDGYFDLDKAKNQNCQLENPNQPYFLFALNKLGTPDAFANCKLRFFKIYENENLKMDLIPFKIGDTVGLLDNVTKIFFSGELMNESFTA